MKCQVGACLCSLATNYQLDLCGISTQILLNQETRGGSTLVYLWEKHFLAGSINNITAFSCNFRVKGNEW